MLTRDEMRAVGLSDSQIEELLQKQAEKSKSDKLTFTKYYLGIKTTGSIKDKLSFLRKALERLPIFDSNISFDSFSEKEVDTKSLLRAIASVCDWNVRGEHIEQYAKEIDEAPAPLPQDETTSALADILD